MDSTTRESSQISEESKSEDRDQVVSSTSNIYLDGLSDSLRYKEDVCEKTLRLVVYLTETAEDKIFTEQENEQQMVEVRSRKLNEKGRYYQTEVKVKAFKSKKPSFTGTLRKTLLPRGQCNELPTWKQEFSRVQVLWSELTDAYNEIREFAQEEEFANVRDTSEQVCGEWKSEDRDEVVSSASNIYLDGLSDSLRYKEEVCEKTLRLIVYITETAEDKIFTEQENDKQMVEVRSRKLNEKGRYYQTEVKVKAFKPKKPSLTGTLRKTLLLRGQCNELPTWKQEFSMVQVLWNELTDAYNEIGEFAQDRS